MHFSERMTDKVRSEFDRYISYISKMDGVLHIYLFGSYADGKATEGSDIDLMVVVRDDVDSLKVLQGVSRGLMNRQVSFYVLVDNLSDFVELSEPDRVTLQREIKNGYAFQLSSDIILGNKINCIANEAERFINHYK